jgi:hypothetical protein
VIVATVALALACGLGAWRLHAHARSRRQELADGRRQTASVWGVLALIAAIELTVLAVAFTVASILHATGAHNLSPGELAVGAACLFASVLFSLMGLAYFLRGKADYTDNVDVWGNATSGSRPPEAYGWANPANVTVAFPASVAAVFALMFSALLLFVGIATML